MNSAQHLIIAVRTRLIPIEIFARGRWVVVEMTDDREAIDRKFQALQRFARRYKGYRKPAIEVVVFASQKSDIGVVSVVGLHNAAAAPKLADVFATGRGVRNTFWQNIFAMLGEEFEPPVARYDAIAEERLFASAAAKAQAASRKAVRRRIELVGAAVAALVLIGFAGAWFLENMTAAPAIAPLQEQVGTDGKEPVRNSTKSERMSSLAAYFSDEDE